jgi:hypothetical protein
MTQTYTADDLARARAELAAARQTRLRERIRGLRAANPHVPLKRIAAEAGVSLAAAQEALAGEG